MKSEASPVFLEEKDVDELVGDGEYEDEEDEDENSNDFRVRDPLKPPSACMFTCETLHRLIHDGDIDLIPPYQRDVVWPESKQVHLIDSIFRNFYIPPVIFAVQPDQDGIQVRVCVDGKQRLTSIQKFFDGQIPHRDSKTKKTWWYTLSEANKKVRNELPAEYKKQFAEKQITCVEYHGIAPGTEREIFQRVQLGVTLTAAEKLQAIASPWAEWVNELGEKHIEANGDGLSNVLDWDTSRGRDFQAVAQLVYCCDGLPSHNLPTTQKLEKWIVRVDSPTGTFKSQINAVFSAFWHIATTTKLNKPFTQVEKRIAPVEFVFIGVLLYVMRDYSFEDRSEAVYNMRIFIRKQYIDVRNNGRVGNSLWQFVQSIMHPGSVNLDQLLPTPKPKPRVKGQKRKAADDDDDDDFRPGSPVRNLGSSKAKTRSKVIGR